MGAFEPPPLGSPAKPTQTKSLGTFVLIGVGAFIALSVGSFAVGIPWTRYRAERFCAQAPAVGAAIDLEPLTRDAAAQTVWVSLSVRDEARRHELLEMVERISGSGRRAAFVFPWPYRPESIAVAWHFAFPSTTCVIEYERGVVTRKHVEFHG